LLTNGLRASHQLDGGDSHTLRSRKSDPPRGEKTLSVSLRSLADEEERTTKGEGKKEEKRKICKMGTKRGSERGTATRGGRLFRLEPREKKKTRGSRFGMTGKKQGRFVKRGNSREKGGGRWLIFYKSWRDVMRMILRVQAAG